MPLPRIIQVSYKHGKAVATIEQNGGFFNLDLSLKQMNDLIEAFKPTLDHDKMNEAIYYNFN
jgi:hypothetical protein